MTLNSEPGAEMPERFVVENDQLQLVGDHWRGRAVAAGSRPPGDVILMHGGGQTRGAWFETARALAALGWNAVSFDARGHGESGWHPDGDYRSQRMVGDLLAVAALCATPPVLVGASMGGVSALLAAGDPANGFRAIVLVDVALRVATVEGQRVMDFMLANPEGFPDLEAVADAIHAYNPARPRSRSLESLKRNVVLRADGRWHWRWDPRLLKQASVMEQLEANLRAAAARIAIPTLLVRGERSQMVTADGLAEFKAYIPHAEVADIAGAGHMVAGDDNANFSRAITNFLGRLPPV